MDKEKILVVEDNEDMLNGIRDILEMSGYQVLAALNGDEALECLEQHRPALIVSDIMMPQMDGYQLFSAVRANPEWLRTPFIFLTAKDLRMDVRLGKQLGVDDYLTKPFEPEDLIVAVEAKLERAASLQAAEDAETSRLKQNILRSFSHEFRTPLTYIRGYLDLIFEEGVEQLSMDELHEFLQGMSRGSERLSRLVDDLIFLVTLETGEAVNNVYSEQLYFAGLRPLVEMVVQQKLPAARKRNVILEYEIPEVLPGVVIHIDYIRDTLERLIENAIKFSPAEQGRVVVRATADREWVYIAVQDNGIGISEEELSSLFKRLHQINREQMEQAGLGTGLAIANGIAEIHGGGIEVESKAGRGSMFTLVLPVAEEAPDAEHG